MKKILFYLLFNSLLFCITILVIQKGKSLPVKTAVKTMTVADAPVSGITDAFNFKTLNDARSIFLHNLKNPISLLLLQIIVILITARVFGSLFKRLGQPTVVGEIIAGIFLGPSLLGFFCPGLTAFLFPSSSLISLQYLSQIGLTFFMFSIGMDLDLKNLSNSKRDAVIISHTGIAIQFLLGVILAFSYFTQFAPGGISFLSFSLFMGITMSITAFPVLARILQERGLNKTALGGLAITCAASDDITAWCILAVVIAIVKAGSLLSAGYTIVLAILYIFVMLYLIKPLLEKLSQKHFNKERVNRHLTALTFLVLLVSAFTAEMIGIHSLFGAFIAGVIMPDDMKFRQSINLKIEDISKIILLPIFFAITGLRTQVGLLSGGYLWVVCGIVILIAVAGKLAGITFTSRLLGQSWKDSVSLGILMNTRGLMELVVLNIGYDLGIISPLLFAILVLMALATTLMTGPLLNMVNLVFRKR